MAKQDYYEALGVDQNADDKAIRTAFRDQAKRFHPDRNPGNNDAESRFKEINEAYDVLKNPQTRAAYNQYGHAAFESGRGGGSGGFDSAFNNASVSDIFEDLFSDFMGGGRRSGGDSRQRGGDLAYDLDISLEDAFRGKNSHINFHTQKPCNQCQGKGTKSGSRPRPCSTCQGHGKVRMQQGFFTIQRACSSCHGSGQLTGDPCDGCHGSGRVKAQRTLSVNVPRGIETGNRIRLSGEGEAGLNGGPNGDLYLAISIKSHDVFERHDSDILCHIPIPMTKAALGGSVEVPDIEGRRVSIKIPEGSQHGRRFRLRGKGMPHLHSGARGDMYVELSLEVPIRLSAQQKALLEQFQSETNDKNTPTASGFFTKIKNFWDTLQD